MVDFNIAISGSAKPVVLVPARDKGETDEDYAPRLEAARAGALTALDDELVQALQEVLDDLRRNHGVTASGTITVYGVPGRSHTREVTSS